MARAKPKGSTSDRDANGAKKALRRALAATTSNPPSLIDALAHPTSTDVDFEAPRVGGGIFTPADLR